MASLRELLDQAKKEKAATATTPNSKAVLEAATAAPVLSEAKPITLIKPPTTPFSRIQPKKTVEPLALATKEVPNGSVKSNGETGASVPSSTAKPAGDKSDPHKEAEASRPPVPVVGAVNDKSWDELRNNLAFLANNIEQKELVGQAVRNIAKQLQLNPQFESKMVRSDFNLIVRGLRSAFTVAARKKIERTETKSVASAEVNDLMQMAKDMGISLS